MIFDQHNKNYNKIRKVRYLPTYNIYFAILFYKRTIINKQCKSQKVTKVGMKSYNTKCVLFNARANFSVNGYKNNFVHFRPIDKLTSAVALFIYLY